MRPTDKSCFKEQCCKWLFMFNSRIEDAILKKSVSLNHCKSVSLTHDIKKKIRRSWECLHLYLLLLKETTRLIEKHTSSTFNILGSVFHVKWLVSPRKHVIFNVRPCQNYLKINVWYLLFTKRQELISCGVHDLKKKIVS